MNYRRTLLTRAVQMLALTAALMLASTPPAQIIAVAPIVLHITGLFIARWLFFAEAEHVVGLYYDKR